jgi:ElaB/YqjD/DUF883 family membrane-anchored ribosome-binding protein
MGHPALSTDGKALTKELIEALKSEVSMLKVYLEQQDLFVFLTCLDEVIKQYKDIAGKPANWFFNEFKDQEAELLKQKRDLIDPIKRFMESPQATIYKSINEFIKDNKLNLSHLDTDSIKTLQDVLADHQIYIGSKIKDAKLALEFLKDQLTRLLNQERQKALQEVTPLYESLKAKVSGKHDLLNRIEEAYQQVLRSINQETLIPMIASTKSYFTEHTYLDLLNEIEADIAPKGGDKPKTMIISAKSLKPKFSKEIIETGADLDEYLKSLKQTYLTELDKGNRIKV